MSATKEAFLADKKLGHKIIINIPKIGFEPTPPDHDRPATFWSNVDNVPTEPTLILARTLAARGLEVSVSEPYKLPTERYVGVHASPENQRLLHRLTATPEMRALSIATDGVTSPETQMNQSLEHCWWNTDTQRRVRALYWQNRGAYCQGVADTIDTHPSYKFHKEQDRKLEEQRLRQEAEQANASSTELLGDSQPMGVEDLQSFVDKVVERELNPDYTKNLLADVNIPWLKR